MKRALPSPVLLRPSGPGVPLLMLDFDGVLHPSQGDDVPEFSLAPTLAEALEGYPCDIVVTSTWREHHPLPDLLRRLPPALAHRVVGTTGADVRGPHGRFRTILSWLQEHRSVAQGPASVGWMALDDTASEFPPGCPRLILCDGMTGLARGEVAALRAWLAAHSS